MRRTPARTHTSALRPAIDPASWSTARGAGRPHRIGWPAVVVLVVLSLFASACTDSDETGESGSDDSGSPAESDTGGSGDTGGSAAEAGSGFVIPAELLARVEEAGHEFPAVDYPEQPEDVVWPTEQWQQGPFPEGVDEPAARALVADAFAVGGETDTIDAVLVVKGGELVLEEYNNWDPEARHNSWSMAKSITAALIGRLVEQGEVDPFGPAAADEWQDEADPRNGLTVDELLRMSSGLEWEESYTDADGDVLSVLAGSGMADRAGYSAAKPLDDQVDTVFEYSTGTANIVAREVAYEVGFGEEFTDWIQSELFDPIGIAPAEHQMDERGVINGGSWVNLRPVDFARFGLLFLRGGEWDGERILPDGWVDYSRLPTPTDPEGTYGAHWWLIPERPGVFWASGYNGQSITVVPQEDLVVVVLSTTQSPRSKQLRNDLLTAFAGPPPGA